MSAIPLFAWCSILVAGQVRRPSLDQGTVHRHTRHHVRPHPASHHGAAIGLDHVGIVGADLEALARVFSELGFHLTPRATHASGRTANRCVMLRDGYMELMATVPGESSATLNRFLARGAGAHILALEVEDEAAVLERLRRAGITGDVSLTERDADQQGAKARFALILPPDPPEGRMLLIRHLTRDLLWRPDNVEHPNHAVALAEVVYASDTPAETMTRLSRLTGRPAEPDPWAATGFLWRAACCVSCRVLRPKCYSRAYPEAVR